MDLTKKFLYINPDGTSGEQDSAICYPASSLVAIETTSSATTLKLFFKDAAMADTTEVTFTVDTNTGKDVAKTIVEHINFDKNAYVTVADDAEGVYIHPSITAVATPSLGDTSVTLGGSGTVNGTLQVKGLAKLTTIAEAAGTDLADDTAAVSLADADHGKTFLCLTADKDKTINLPTNVGTSDIGMQITIIQNVDLITDGYLRIVSNDTFALNSYAIGYNSSRYLAAARPADANNTVTITGSDSNSAWGIGSTAVFTVVANDEWHVAIKAEPLGTGSNAIAFS